MSRRSHWRRIISVLALVVGAGVAAIFARDAVAQRFDRPELTVRVSPAKPYLQEQIVHTVRLVSAHRFEELNLDLPEIEGAETIIVSQPNIRPFLSYGVEGFVYETTRVVFAQKSGTLRIPRVRIDGAIVVGDEEIRFDRVSEDIEIPIAPIPSGYEGDAWLVSALIQMREEYDTPFDGIRVGDTVRRSVTVTAKGSTGAHIPELTMRASRGLNILPRTPKRRTEETVAGVTGILEQDFDITVVEGQTVDFGPVRMVWWDAEADAGRRSALRAVRVEPLPRDTAAIKEKLIQSAAARQRNSRVVLTLSALCAVALIAVLFVVIVRRRLIPADRMLLRRARARPDPVQSMASLYDWANANYGDNTPIGVAELKAKLDADIHGDIDRLAKLAFGNGNQTVNFEALSRRVIRCQQRRRSLSQRFKPLLDFVCGAPRRLPRID